MATQGRRLGYHTPEQISNQEPPDSRLCVLTTTLLGGAGGVRIVIRIVIIETPSGLFWSMGAQHQTNISLWEHCDMLWRVTLTDADLETIVIAFPLDGLEGSSLSRMGLSCREISCETFQASAPKGPRWVPPWLGLRVITAQVRVVTR